MSNDSQKTGELIRSLREHKEMPLRKVAALLDIDTSFLSKIERNIRRATKEQIHKLEEIFEVKNNSLLISYLSDKICYELIEENCAMKVLEIAMERINSNNKD